MKASHPLPEPAADTPAKPASRPSVEINDAGGSPLGFTITLKDERVSPDEAVPGEASEVGRLRHLAKSVSGWSSFFVDNEKYSFSQAHALTLFQRYPHIADQVDRALKPKKEHA